MPRRMLRLTALAILFIAAVLTPRQGGAAGGGPLPAGTANPVRPEQPPTAVGWQAPRRLRSVGGGAVLPAQRGTVRRAGALPARAALAHAGHGAVAAGMARDVAQAYGNLPLAFERNEGQTDPSVSYLAHSQGYTAFLTQEGITLALAPVTGTTTLPEKPGLFTARPALAATPVPGPVVSMRLDGASGQTQAQAANPLPGVVNYFIGNNPSTWHTNIPTYGQGNVVALTTQSGTVVDSYQYDQWGKPTSVSESVPQQLRYAGYWYDSELGWYWTTVREYDPTLERFLQPDPSEQEGLFSYAYAGDNPTDNMDPSGLDTQPGKSCLLSKTSHQFDCDEAAGSGQWKEDTGEGDIVVTGPEAACPFHPNIAWHIAWSSFNLCDWYANNQGWIKQFGEYFKRLLNYAIGFTCTITNICSDFQVLLSNAAWYYKLQAALDIVTWLPELEELKGPELAVRLAKLGISKDRFTEIRVVAEDIIGCAFCFPAGTTVATPEGQRPIQDLRVGDTVLSENPRSGKVEAEPVLAVRHDPISPLLEVDLSDGSSIRVTADHPFWVEWGADLDGSGWLAAGQLRIGDQLRSADGQDVTVVGVRQHAGTAVVYTLTVAIDHTFFAGSARVLVHNAASCGAKVNVTDPYLQNVVNGLWKQPPGASVIGGGSAIDALVNEAATGVPTNGIWHDQKIDEAISGLTNWLARPPGMDEQKSLAVHPCPADRMPWRMNSGA